MTEACKLNWQMTDKQEKRFSFAHGGWGTCSQKKVKATETQRLIYHFNSESKETRQGKGGVWASGVGGKLWEGDRKIYGK